MPYKLNFSGHDFSVQTSQKYNFCYNTVNNLPNIMIHYFFSYYMLSRVHMKSRQHIAPQLACEWSHLKIILSWRQSYLNCLHQESWKDKIHTIKSFYTTEKLGYLVGALNQFYFHTSLYLNGNTWTWASGVQKPSGWQPDTWRCNSIFKDPQGAHTIMNAYKEYCTVNSTYARERVLCESKYNYVL